MGGAVPVPSSTNPRYIIVGHLGWISRRFAVVEIGVQIQRRPITINGASTQGEDQREFASSYHRKKETDKDQNKESHQAKRQPRKFPIQYLKMEKKRTRS